MSRLIQSLGILTLVGLLSVPVLASDARELSWNDLLPQRLDGSSRVPYGEQVRMDLDRQNVRIPGYVVPLEYDDDRAVTRFLLVPYFGACIHEPPPPPNQTIYGEFEGGFEMKSMWYPFWIEGTVSVSRVDSPLATASYDIDVNVVDPYERN